MAINISSKYKDIISRCTKISSGSPAVYQLRPKKEKIGNLKIMTVGVKNMKRDKTVLLVGETGAGKSTLINALVNYSMGVKWEDEVWFQIVEKEKKKCHSESQTSDVIVYKIFGFEDEILPYSLTIIDTPGFGDTKGLKHDQVIIQRLCDLFRSEDGVHEVHAMGLVMKATDNRLSDRLKYVFNSVMSLVGNDMEKNIVALITHSDGRRPNNALLALEDAKIKCARNEKNQPVYFLFNNCQHEDRTEEEKDYLEHTDKISERGMRNFTVFLDKTVPQKLVKTVEVVNDRIRLTACIQNLKERIELIELKQATEKQNQEALKEHEEKMKKNEDLTLYINEHDKKILDNTSWLWRFCGGSQGAVCCTVCKENCHHPCIKAIKLEDCMIMKDGYCTVCTRKCPVSHHVRENWIYETKIKEVKMTTTEMKQKYEESESPLENLEKEIKQLTAEKSQLLDEAYQYVVRLEQIALKADSVSTIVHLDFLIEKMKEKGDTEKAQKLEEIRSRVDQGTRIAQWYVG